MEETGLRPPAVYRSGDAGGSSPRYQGPQTSDAGVAPARGQLRGQGQAGRCVPKAHPVPRLRGAERYARWHDAGGIVGAHGQRRGVGPGRHQGPDRKAPARGQSRPAVRDGRRTSDPTCVWAESPASTSGSAADVPCAAEPTGQAFDLTILDSEPEDGDADTGEVCEEIGSCGAFSGRVPPGSVAISLAASSGKSSFLVGYGRSAT